MARFMVERYMPGSSRSEVQTLVERIGSIWETDVDGVTYVRSVVIPDDEALLCEFEAENAQAVKGVHDRFGLPFDRVIAVDLSAPTPRGDRERGEYH